jgi:hypothetical protein
MQSGYNTTSVWTSDKSEIVSQYWRTFWNLETRKPVRILQYDSYEGWIDLPNNI